MDVSRCATSRAGTRGIRGLNRSQHLAHGPDAGPSGKSQRIAASSRRSRSIGVAASVARLAHRRTVEGAGEVPLARRLLTDRTSWGFVRTDSDSRLSALEWPQDLGDVTRVAGVCLGAGVPVGELGSGHMLVPHRFVAVYEDDVRVLGEDLDQP